VEHPSLGSCASTVVTIVIAVGTDGAGEIAVDTVEGLADEGGNSLITALKACLGGESFTAATKVLLASGKAVPIASLKPGQKVLAANVKTGKTRAETISAVLVRHDTDLFDLQIRAYGRTAIVATTSSHLFWVPGAGGHGGRWIKAAALKHGTHLRTPDGRTATVTGGWTPHDTTGSMWDLTIPADHDFYIETTAAAILVHNVGCELPRLDATGKVHGDLPRFVPAHWTSEDLQQLESDLIHSIATRKQGLIDLGEDPAHRYRLQQELQLLRQVQKRLGGS
jgi:hypothetical protein